MDGPDVEAVVHVVQVPGHCEPGLVVAEVVVVLMVTYNIKVLLLKLVA